MDGRRRFFDGFVGAVIVLLLQGVLLGAAFFLVSRPAGSGDTTGVPTTAPQPEVEPPDDLPRDATWLADLQVTSSALHRGNTPLQDIELAITDVRSESGQVTIGSLRGSATAGFETIAAQVGEDARVSYVDADHLRIERTIQTFRRVFEVAAVATVTPDGRDLVVEPTNVTIAGAPGGGLLADATRPFLTVRKPVPGLSEDMTVERASIRPNGLALEFAGSDVRWR